MLVSVHSMTFANGKFPDLQEVYGTYDGEIPLIKYILYLCVFHNSLFSVCINGIHPIFILKVITYGTYKHLFLLCYDLIRKESVK